MEYNFLNAIVSFSSGMPGKASPSDDFPGCALVFTWGRWCVDISACVRRHMDIGRVDLYEQVGWQAGLQIQVVIAGAGNAEQSAFIYSAVCVSRYVRLG